MTFELLATQRAISGPTAWASHGHLFEMQGLKPSKLHIRNPHFYKILKWFGYTINFEKCCSNLPRGQFSWSECFARLRPHTSSDVKNVPPPMRLQISTIIRLLHGRRPSPMHRGRCHPPSEFPVFLLSSPHPLAHPILLLMLY